MSCRSEMSARCDYDRRLRGAACMYVDQKFSLSLLGIQIHHTAHE